MTTPELASVEEPEPLHAYDLELARRLLAYGLPHLGGIVTAVVLIVLSSVFQLAGPLLTAAAIDLYLRPPAEAAPASLRVGRAVEGLLAAAGVEASPSAGLAALACLFLAALVSTFAVLYAQGYVMQMTGQRVMLDLRRQLFGHLQRLPLPYFDRHPIGRLVTRVTNDVDALNELFAAGMVAILGDLALLGGIVGVLFWLNWRLALVTFSILPLLALLAIWFKSRARQSYRRVRTKLAALNAFLQERLGGMSTIQLFGREAAELDTFEGLDEAHRKANVDSIFYYAIYYPGVELITALGLALILWYGGLRVVGGLLSLGALVAFLQYAQRFYQPLADLSEKYNVVQSALAAGERVFELLDARPSIVSPPDAWSPAKVRGEIVFDRVDFAYLPGEPVLSDLSFRVAPGETVAVVGHTGAGKSTLASLLLRLYDVDGGSVAVDGVDLRRWELGRLRRSIGLVLQDVFLFSGTLAENIRLGDPSIDDDRLRRAARESRAAAFIERLPQGYETRVRERGAGLSVGQKQLIAFARALAFDPAILVLDEATSSIDTETEAAIQEALGRLLEGRTSLVIAHRLSTVRRADRILVLHHGRLREEGTHEELLERRGIYWRLVELQYGRAAEPAGDTAGPDGAGG